MTEPVHDAPGECPAGSPEDCPLIPQRRTDDPWKAEVAAAINSLRDRDQELAAAIRATHELTQQVYDNTRAIVEAVDGAGALWGFLKRWSARFARFARFIVKWATLVGALVLVIYQIGEHSSRFDLLEWVRRLFTGGGPPPPPMPPGAD